SRRTVPVASVKSVELPSQPCCVWVDVRVNMSMMCPLISAMTNCLAPAVLPNTSLVPSGERPGDGFPVVATTSTDPPVTETRRIVPGTCGFPPGIDKQLSAHVNGTGGFTPK